MRFICLVGFYYCTCEFLALYPLLLEGVLALLIIAVLFRKIHLLGPARQYQGGLWGFLFTKHHCSLCTRGKICLGLSALKKPLEHWKWESGQAESFLNSVMRLTFSFATYSS